MSSFIAPSSFQAIVDYAQHHLKTAFLIVSIALYFVFKIYQSLLAVYRVNFHPLRDFSGPRQACISEAWLYREVKKGFPEETFETLHKKYNTNALRIGPNELHISDIEMYKVIYSQSKPFLKYTGFYDGFNTPHTVFAETDPTLHKERRRLLNPLFSRAGVFQLEPIIHDKLSLLGEKIDRLGKTRSINTYDAFRLLTTEIIMEFAFARSANMIVEQADGFSSWFLDGFDVAANSIADFQFFPMFGKVTHMVPVKLVKALSHDLGKVVGILEFAAESVRHWQSKKEKSDHPVAFDSLTSLSDADKVTEAVDILIAGADTTASTLTTGLLNILTNSDIHRKLVSALDAGLPSNEEIPSLKSLEKIDYLNACVKESIRMGMAVPGRLPRVVPGGDADPFIVDGKVVPPGADHCDEKTVVSITAYTMNTSTRAWGPDARSFNPERWLGDSKGLDQYMCSFSKGARMCIGQNLASAELTIVLAYILRKYKLSLAKDFVEPGKIDRFTLNYLPPGLPVKFEPRQ